MQIIITARNCEIAPDVREATDQRFEHMTKFEPRVSRAEVVFTGEKNHVRAEALLSVDRGERIHGQADGPDPKAALDRLAQKLRVQLRRIHERHHAHRAPPMDELFGAPDGAEEDATPGATE